MDQVLNGFSPHLVWNKAQRDLDIKDTGTREHGCQGPEVQVGHGIDWPGSQTTCVRATGFMEGVDRGVLVKVPGVGTIDCKGPGPGKVWTIEIVVLGGPGPQSPGITEVPFQNVLSASEACKIKS